MPGDTNLINTLSNAYAGKKCACATVGRANGVVLFRRLLGISRECFANEPSIDWARLTLSFMGGGSVAVLCHDPKPTGGSGTIPYYDDCLDDDDDLSGESWKGKAP